MPAKANEENYLNRVKDKHGDKVEILSEYKGGTVPIKLKYKCSHGETIAVMNAKSVLGMNFCPCKKCHSEKMSDITKGSSESDKKTLFDRMLKQCESVGIKPIETEWITAKTHYHFKCSNPDHPIFETTADCIMSKKQGCPYCCGRRGDFQNRYKSLIESKNGTMLSEYVNNSTKIKVRCNADGYKWDVLPSNLSKGRWCPVCNMNFNERVTYDWFMNNSLKVVPQYSFDDLVSIDGVTTLKFDFAVMKNNSLRCLVEIDDAEHRNNPRTERRIVAQKRDVIKNEYCQKNNIQLIRIEVPYNGAKYRWSYENFYSYINEKLNCLIA